MMIFAKAVAISLIAGVTAPLPFAILFAVGMDVPLALFAGVRYLAFGVVASVAIGLPLAMLVFKLIKDDQSFDRSRLLFVANGAAFVITAVLGFASGWFGALFLGLPTFLAANVYALAGWRLILCHYREEQFA